MEIFYWAIIVMLFIIAFVGLIYPVIPSAIFLLAGYLMYGVFFSFESFGWFFWLVQGSFVLLLFVADYVANLIGVKKFGGSKAGIWGSTIGLLMGPFLIPGLGILLGPFLGAFVAEMTVNKRPILEAVKIGFGSVVGFISSVITKGVIQALMVVYFYYIVL